MTPADLWNNPSVVNNSNVVSGQYVLSPVNAIMTINKPLNSKKQPRVVANLQLDTLRLGLSDLQFRKSVTGARNVIMLRKARQYWKARLSVQVSGEARRRWQYAINCTLDLVYFRRKGNT